MPPTQHRKEKMEQQLQRLLASYLQQQWSNRPRETFVTVLSSTVSPDLHYATIYIGVFPERHQDDVLEALNNDIHTIQQHINKQLRTRPVPRLRFIPDTGEQKRAEIERLLHDK